jgi:c-di-GMP-binding flagellar brake protein YcgR
MKKQVTICFRTSEDLRVAVEKVAQQDHRSLSSAIELILMEYLSRNADYPQQHERRRYGRKQVSIPARIKTADAKRKHYKATILDISLSGMRVSLPKESLPELYEGRDTPQFETSFVLPQDDRSLRIVCRPQRVVPVNGSIQVGASFVDTEFTQYQQLQQYLM